MKNHRDKQMLLAYALSEEFGYSKKKIADLMEMSQQTIGSWVKEVGYKQQIHGLERELVAVRQHLHKIGYHEPKPLDPRIIDIN